MELTLEVPILTDNSIDDMGNQAGGVLYGQPSTMLPLDSSGFYEHPQSLLSAEDVHYGLHTTSHKSDTLGRPVVVFDRWEILRTELLGKNVKLSPLSLRERGGGSEMKTYFSQRNSDTDSSSSFEELTRFEMNKQSSDSEQSQHVNSNKRSFKVHSLLISGSRDPDTALVSQNKEVSNDLPGALVSDSRAVSADALNRMPPSQLAADRATASADDVCGIPKAQLSLQQRRNKRPTSLQIQSISLPPSLVLPLVIPPNSLSLPPVARQRSHSMPSSVMLEQRDEPPANQKHSLDEALALLSKRKLTRHEINEQSLLHRAADAGHVKLLKKCVTAGCNLNQRLNMLNGATALHCAVRADNNAVQVSKILLDAGIDVNACNDLGETAIFSAIIHKNMECVDLLVDHGCDLNIIWQHSTPLYLMLHNRSVEVSGKAIKMGAIVTSLQAHLQQPLHTVIDLCQSQPITQRSLDALFMVMQADGRVVEHLHSYTSSRPGSSQQELTQHIYRMVEGPLKDEGKRLVRTLIKLGFTPSRGELAIMCNSGDSTYEDTYAYIKSGTAPLADLCVRTIRRECAVNVVHALENWKHRPPAARERAQILLQAPPTADPDYENVSVFRRDKSQRRRSHRKSLKSFMDGIARLSKRFSNKKDKTPPLSLPKKEQQMGQLSRAKSGSVPAAINSADETDRLMDKKPKYVKRESKKGELTVADIVKRYSNSDKDMTSSSSEGDGSTKMPLDNPAYSNDETDVPTIAYTARITLGVDGQGAQRVEDTDSLTVQFHDEPSLNKKYTTPSTPVSLQKTLGSSYGVYKSTIHVTGDY